ncbi:MAG: hypothetical protein Hals2KO_39550 [Halioglobus sp.]
MAEATKPGSPERQLLRKFVAAGGSGEQQAKFFRRLAVFVAVTKPSRIFMLGHRSARDLQPLFRAGRDQFVTTVREPLQVTRSLAAYRVYRIMQGGAAASRILNAMNLDLQRFEALLKDDPRELVRQIMHRESPSLCAALSFGNDATAASVWADLRNSRCCIAHSSEQAPMLQTVFGKPVNNYSENTAVGREGSGANFAEIVEDEWLAPFIDPQDSLLYERFDRVGLIGFWRGGGSLDDYHELLASG